MSTETTCPKCNAACPDSQKFCGQCGTKIDGDQGPLMSEVLDEYDRRILIPRGQSARHSGQSHLRYWVEALGHIPLRELTAPDIARARDALFEIPTRKGTRKSGATVARYCAMLRHFLNLCAGEWGYLQASPFRTVRMPRESPPRVRYLSDEERKRLLHECQRSRSRWLYPLVILALSTAARKGELLGLRWPDVDFERQTITFRTTKNHEPHLVPIGGLAFDLLKGLPRGNEFCFPNKIREAWVRARERAGIENFRFHDLRHSAASYLAQRGASLLEIGQVLNHKSPAMTFKYAHLQVDHAREILGNMTADIFGEANANNGGARHDNVSNVQQ